MGVVAHRSKSEQLIAVNAHLPWIQVLETKPKSLNL